MLWKRTARRRISPRVYAQRLAPAHRIILTHSHTPMLPPQSATLADRMRQSAEMARLSEAMAQQSSTLSELDELLGHAGSGARPKSSGNGNGAVLPDSSGIAR